MEKIRLEITGIEYSQTHSGSYVLHLKEVKGNRRMPIVIGSFEAQAIAVELEKMVPNRPMTHDLFKSVFGEVNILVKEVVIHQFREGLFIAKVTLIGQNGVEVDIDSRSSDAVAIAVRFNVPIFTTLKVLNEVNNISEGQASSNQDEEIDESDHVELDLDEDALEASIEELEHQLQEALENEDYELAMKIRDEINKRKK